MPEPFPGMDPYLERPDLWPDVHQVCGTACAFQSNTSNTSAMTINTDHLEHTLRALETALMLYERAAVEQSGIEQEIFRMAIIKGLELAQEISIRLIRRRLRDFGYTARRPEATPVKEFLRLAAQHSLLSLAEVERWFAYRDNRNSTAHDYGEAFVQQTLHLLSDFIRDAHNLTERLRTGSLLEEEAHDCSDLSRPSSALSGESACYSATVRP